MQSEKEYLEKIVDDESLLRSYKSFSRNKNAQIVATIINDLKNAVFGSLLPPELDDDNGMKNADIRDMPPLEIEEETEKRQKGQGLKIMTPKQMITRLSILLAQIKAGNNSQKLKNEIGQIVYGHRK